MALTIEDGTGVVGANSYVSLLEIRLHAVERGYTLPAADDALEILAIKAMDYLEALRNDFKGIKKYGLGYLQWPRQYVVIDGFELAEDAIPAELKKAQCQLAFELQTADPGPVTAPDLNALSIKRERIDVLETEYFTPAESSYVIRLPKVDALLAPLLRGTGPLTVVRI